MAMLFPTFKYPNPRPILEIKERNKHLIRLNPSKNVFKRISLRDKLIRSIK